jgi:CDGSH-type Zn-finger protein
MKLFKVKSLCLKLKTSHKGINNFASFCFTETETEATKLKFTDVYKTKNKMPKPDIENWIDAQKFTQGNVTLETKSRTNLFNKNKYKSKSSNIASTDSNNKENKAITENKTNSNSKENEKTPIPLSPKLGPFEILNPQIEDKAYHWCSCGLSKKQPFCDRSHKGTAFKPINFRVGEKVDKMNLCGCKLSSKAPFCDGETCKSLSEKYEESIQEKLKKLNEKAEKITI